MRVIPSLILTGTLLSSSATAGDDLEFAKTLARDGQEELAAEMCDRMEKSAATAEEKAAVALVRAEILSRAALRKHTLKEAREALEGAAQAFERFATERPAHASTPEARLRGGIIRRQQGEIATAEADKGETERAALQAEAKRLFGLAIAAFGAVTEGDTAAEAAYEKARTRFAASHLEPDGTKERKAALAAALSDFVEFEFDFGHSWLLFEASIPWGEVYDRLGRHKEALARYDVAISLAEAEGGALQGWAREVVLSGYEAKSASQVRARELHDAVATARSMIASVKDALKDRAGAMTLLHEVEALQLAGRGPEAEARLKELQAPGVPAEIAALVNQRIVATGVAAPAAALAVARDALQAGRVDQALRLLRRVWTDADRKETPELAADALWLLAAVSDQHEDRPVEAALEYEAFLEEFPADARAPRAAFHAARMWNRVAAGADGWEKDQAVRLLGILASRWPADPIADDSAFLVAESSYKKGDWERAAAEFAKIPDASTLKETARVYAGRALERLGASLWHLDGRQDDARAAFAKAEEGLRRFLDDASANEAREARRDQRRGLVLAARETLVAVLLHDARGDYPQASLQLDAILKAGPPDQSLRRALRQRVTADVAQGFLSSAVAAADELQKRFPRSPAAAEGALAAARGCDAKGEELAGPAPAAGKIPAAAAGLWEEAARLYAAWVESAATTVEAETAFAAAQRVIGLGVLVNGLDEAACPAADAEGTPEKPEFFRSAARILGRIEAPSHASRVRIALAGALAMAGDWARAREAAEAVVVEERLLLADGSLNVALVRRSPGLLSSYEDYGHALIRSPGEGADRRASLDAAWKVMGYVTDLVEKQSRGWWRCKVGAIAVLLERGREGDFEMAWMGLDSLRSNYPDLDGGRYGIRRRVEAMERRIRESSPR
jgi:TolA-binding protein